MHMKTFFLTCGLFLVFTTLALSQSLIPRSLVSNGGGISADQDKRVQMSVGQPLIGWVIADTLQAQIGFWHISYLPPADDITSTIRDRSLGPELSQNYPNPFRSWTAIHLYLPQKVSVRFSIYSADGQLIQTIANREMEPGHYHFKWDATHVAPGTYHYEVVAGDHHLTKSMHVVR